jgi:soluble lytic murein transglycosylase
MKTLTPLKWSLIVMQIGMLSYPQSIHSAGAIGFEFNEIPLEIPMQTKHARQILGGPEASELTWRGPKMAELLFQRVNGEIAAKHLYLAPQIVSGVLKASLQHGMDPLLLLALIKTESGFNPNARGRHGEIGLMQIMPRTAQWMALRMNITWRGPEALNDPEYNIRLATAYLDFLRRRFSAVGTDYVSAYNMGAANVRRLKAKAVQPAIYANKVLKNYRSLNHQLTIAVTPKPEMRVSLSE